MRKVPSIPHFFCRYRSAFLLSARLMPFVCLHLCNLEKVPFRFLSTPESAWFLAQRLVIFQSQLVFRLLRLRSISGRSWSPPSRRAFARQRRFSQGRGIAALPVLVRLSLLLLSHSLCRAWKCSVSSQVLLVALGDGWIYNAGMDNAAGSGLSLKPQDFIASVAARHQNRRSLAGCKEGDKGKYCRRQNLWRWTVPFFF